MKLRILTLCFLLSFSTVKGQQCFDLCDATNPYPTEFKTQFCWLLNEICYNFNLPKWQEPKRATNEDIKEYLRYSAGESTFYYQDAEVPWGSNWFACKYGGIARRWQESVNQQPVAGINYPNVDNLLNWDQLSHMTRDQLNKLSPAEKLDIFVGNKDFRITKWELIHRGPNRPSHADDNFCGFCNGARSSGALTLEPLVARTVNASAGAKVFDRATTSFPNPQISVTFYPADIKALAAASFYYNEHAYNIGRNNDNSVVDPNPAILDFMLRFLIGKFKTPFFLDVMPNNEIWNETIVGYDRKVVSINPVSIGSASVNLNPAVKKVVTINLKLYCQDEVSISAINIDTKKIMANKAAAIAKEWIKERKYSYKLYVDENDKIIDGSWITTSGWQNRVYTETDLTPIDFIWMAWGGGADNLHAGNPNINYNLIKYLFVGADLREQGVISDPNLSKKQQNPTSVEIPQPMISAGNLLKISH